MAIRDDQPAFVHQVLGQFGCRGFTTTISILVLVVWLRLFEVTQTQTDIRALRYAEV